MARKRNPKGPEDKPPFSRVTLTPTDRFHESTRERIMALEKDKRKLEAEVARLLPYMMECGRLREALRNAQSNNVLATSLIGIGGFLVSYATFTGRSAETWANFAAGCLASGIMLMLVQSFHHWRRGQP